MLCGNSTFPMKLRVLHAQLRQQTNVMLRIMFTFYNYSLVVIPPTRSYMYGVCTYSFFYIILLREGTFPAQTR